MENTTDMDTGNRVVRLIFMGLATLTLVSWVFAEQGNGGREHGSVADRMTVTLVFLIVVIKLHLVAMHFMELKYAPVALRLIVETWIVGVFALIVGIPLFTP